MLDEHYVHILASNKIPVEFLKYEGMKGMSNEDVVRFRRRINGKIVRPIWQKDSHHKIEDFKFVVEIMSEFNSDFIRK